MTNTSSYQSQLAGQLRVAAAPVRTLLGDLSPADVPLPYAVDILDAFIELERLAASGKVLIAARAAEYRPQLERYASLFAADARPLRQAIFFPLQGVLAELP